MSMYRTEYTKKSGWKTFFYDKKEHYYSDFDLVCEKFKKTIYPFEMLTFVNQNDHSNQGYFKMIDNWGVYSHFSINSLSRN